MREMLFMSSKSRTLALALVILFFIGTFMPIKAISIWNSQTISEETRRTFSAAIALDPFNNPQVAYTDAHYEGAHVVGNLIYATRNGSVWDKQNLTVDGAVEGLALDSNDNPHLLYNVFSEDQLVYAERKGLNWSSYVLGNGRSIGSLALDSNGNPHVALLDDGFLKYASRINSTWSIQTLAYANNTYRVFLKIDSNDTPHILYGFPNVILLNVNYRQYENANYATLVGNHWRIQSVLSYVDSFGNLALDSNNYPHFTYCVNSTLFYESWNGSDWDIQAVADNVTNYPNQYLAIDSRNHPNIVYEDRDGNSMVTRGIENKWVVENLSFSIGPIVLDSNDNLHMICLSGGGTWTAALLYIKGDLSELEPQSTQPTTPTITPPFSIQTIQTVSVVALLIIAIISIVVYTRHRKTANSVKKL